MATEKDDKFWIGFIYGMIFVFILMCIYKAGAMSVTG